MSDNRISVNQHSVPIETAISQEQAAPYIPTTAIEKILRILFLFLLLYIFLVGIGLMGASFKLLGEGVVEGLIRATSNPFVGLFIGILATSIVQSSSVTTSLVVGMVSADAISLPNAIPIIMGANIGTSVTNTIVSLGHVTHKQEFKRAFSAATVHDFFNFCSVIILLPLEIATGFLRKTATWLTSLFIGAGTIEFKSPIKVIIKPAVQFAQNFFVSPEFLALSKVIAGILLLITAFACIFFALIFLVKNTKKLMLSNVEKVMDRLFSSNALFAIILGAVITGIIQSSSLTTSLLVPLVGAGILSLEAAFPITIGANIGTTITAILASLAGNTLGVIVAFSHLLFNISGMLLFYPILQLRKIPLSLAKWIGGVAAERKVTALFYILFMFFVLPFMVFGFTRLLGP